MQLIIASKNYSSWSLRPWLLMRQSGIPFEEILVPLRQPLTAETILRYSPCGTLPCLIDGELKVWDSLAICETLAERYPELNLWPSNAARRAHARSVSAEMHAGFSALRSRMPMNIRGKSTGHIFGDDELRDLARVDALWSDCLARYRGPYLFGGFFTIADAMFAPVVMRFNTYSPRLSPAAQAYADVITAMPCVKLWADAARNEPPIDYYDKQL